MAVVRAKFPDRLISRCGDVPWPHRSPDLSVCSFFLWGYHKSRVYEGKPRTLEELKGAIHKQIGTINKELLERVEANFRERLQMCILQNGHHLSGNFSYINSLKWHVITYHFVMLNKFYTKNKWRNIYFKKYVSCDASCRLCFGLSYIIVIGISITLILEI